jgi:ankyrin repeat protein
MGGKQSVVKAAGRGDLERVKECLQKRGRMELYRKEPGGWTALHKAARCGKLDVVSFLLESQAVCLAHHITA